MQAIAPALFGVPVERAGRRRSTSRSAPRGRPPGRCPAATEPPAWEVPAESLPEAEPATALREAYAQVLAKADALLR